MIRITMAAALLVSGAAVSAQRTVNADVPPPAAPAPAETIPDGSLPAVTSDAPLSQPNPMTTAPRRRAPTLAPLGPTAAGNAEEASRRSAARRRGENIARGGGN